MTKGCDRRWYKLHSKPGKKEKERGEIQLSIHFTRHSLTASMFDLSVKDKPRSPFGRLKDKVKGRRKYDLESASAIVPSSGGALDDGDLGLAGKKAKARGGGGFFKSRLRKSSLTQSNTSLGSDSTLSSASSVVGIGAAAEEAAAAAAAHSPSRHSSLSMDRSVRDFLSSPKLTHKRAFSDEVSQIKALPESKSIQSLLPQEEPVSRSSLCINGSHVYCEEPSPKPASLSPAVAAPPPLPQSIPSRPGESFGPGPRAPESELPPWPSSSSSFQKGPPKDPPRFIPSPPILAAQEEDKLSVKTIALNKHRGKVRRGEGLQADSRPVQIATPMVFSSDVMRVRPREEEGEERAKANVPRRGSSKDDTGRRPVGGSLGPSKGVVTAGGEESDNTSGWWGLQGTKELLPKPSPHLVTPIRAPVPETAREEQQPSSRTSGQNPALSSQQELEPSSVAKPEPKRDPAAGPDPSAKYFHLTHEELVRLLLKREAELGRKQEHVRELENYIDRLLVRIMEQSPTLLQIPLGGEPKVAE